MYVGRYILESLYQLIMPWHNCVRNRHGS